MANHASTSMTHSTIAGVVLVRAVYGLVIAVWIAAAAFPAIDPELELAARNIGVPDVTTLPLAMFTASLAGNYQIAAITALVLLVPSVGSLPVIERFLKAEMLAKVG